MPADLIAQVEHRRIGRHQKGWRFIRAHAIQQGLILPHDLQSVCPEAGIF